MMNLLKVPIYKKSQIYILSFGISILFILAGYFYYDYSSQIIHAEKENDLKAISELKIKQLVQWHKEREANVKVLSKSPYFIEGIKNWIKRKDDKQLTKNLIKRLTLQQAEYGYESIFISSTKGEILLANGSDLKKFDQITFNKILEYAEEDEVVFTDFYFCETEHKIHYDIVSSLKSDNNQTMALLVFRAAPEKFIYPFIESWPTASKSAETLIVRKEGDHVVFLNELKHLKNTALKFGIPLTEKDVPAVQAVLGYKGVLEGKDYRDVNVLSYVNNIPGTSWFIIAKVDTDEILSELNFMSAAVGIIVIILILSSTITISWFYNYRQRNIYKSLWETQEEFRTTLHSIGDAVITTDKNGNIKYLNPIAEQLTGWSSKDANGEKLDKVFKIISEENRIAVQSPVVKVINEGIVVGLANHTLLISKEGKEIPIADSGAPIRNENGEIIGVVLVFRDQTEERKAQKLIAGSEAKYRRLFESAKDGILILDAETGEIVDVNPFLVNILGYSHEQFIGKLIWEIGVFKDIAFNYEKFLELQKKGYVRYEDLPLETSNGGIIDVEFVSNVYIVDSRKVIQCNIREITERKRTQEAFRFLSLRQSAILASVPDIIMEVDNNKVYTWANNAGLEFFGDDVIGKEAALYFEGEQETYTNVKPLFNGSENLIYVESWQRRKDGEVRLLAWWCNVLKDGYGNVTGALSTARDVTEQRKAELEIIRLNRVYALLSNINQAIVRIQNKQKLFDEICRIAIEDGKFLMAWIGVINSAANKIDVASSAGLVENFLDKIIIDLTESSSIKDPIAKTLKTGSHFISNDIENDPRMIIWRENALKLGYRSAASFVIKTFGNVIGTLNIYSRDKIFFHDEEIKLLDEMAMDISFALEYIDNETNRKRIEAALRESEEKYRVLFEGAGEGILVADIETKKFNYANPAICRMFGYSEKEFIQLGIFEIHPKDSVQMVIEEFEAQARQEKILAVNIPCLRKDGSIFYAEISTQPVKINGRLMNVGLFTDITERRKSEEKLIESEKKFRTVIEEAVEIVFTMDNRGYFTYVNPAGLKSSGYSLDELRQLKYIDLIEPDYQQKVKRNYFKQFLARIPLSTTEYPFRTKTGEIKWFNQNANLIIEDDEVKGFYVIARDVTERRRIEEVLRESEERFRSLFENATIGIYRTTPAGKIEMANPALVKMLGYSSFDELISRDLKKDGYESGYSRSEFQKIIERDGEVIGLESAWIRKDGTPIYIRESARVIKDKNNAPMFYEGTVENITKRRLAEEELRNISLRQEAILASVPDIIMEVDNNKIYTWANTAGIEFFGDDVVGKEASFYFEGNQETYEIVQPLFGGSENIIYVESLQRRKDGKLRLLAWWCKVLKDSDGNPYGALSTARDITEHKKAEEKIKSSLIEKEVLLREIHHRVKNNMQVISSLLRLQSNIFEGDDIQKAFQESQNRIRTMSLVHERLYQSGDLANIEFHEYVRILANELMRLYELNTGNVKLKLELGNIKLGVDKAIPCGLIINEVLSNSMKYAFPNNGKGEISISLVNKKNNEVELVICDNGIGLPDNLDIKHTESLGIKLIYLLGEDQLGAEIKLDKSHGTKYSFKFKLEN